jgi:hypothetical protein
MILRQIAQSFNNRAAQVQALGGVQLFAGGDYILPE